MWSRFRNAEELISHGIADLRRVALDIASYGLAAADPYEATKALISFDGRTLAVADVGFNKMLLTNSGTIEADENAVSLIIDMAGDASLNNGVFRASSGGILTIQTDTFDQVHQEKSTRTTQTLPPLPNAGEARSTKK